MVLRDWSSDVCSSDLLPQQQLPQVSVGQKVTLTSDAYPGQTFTGKVNAINPKIDPSTRNVQIEASVPNAKRELLPGMFASVRVDQGAPQRYLTVPQTAITFSRMKIAPSANTIAVRPPKPILPPEAEPRWVRFSSDPTLVPMA